MIARASAWRAYSARMAGSRVSSARSPIASRIVPRSRIETLSRSRCCSTRCTSPTPSLSGTTSSTAAAFCSLSASSSLLASPGGSAARRRGGGSSRSGASRSPTRRRRPCSRAPRPRRGALSSIHTAGRPNAGSVVGIPARPGMASPGSIARRWPGMTRAAGDLDAAHLDRRTRASRARRRRGCARGRSRCPSSEAIWRRTTPTRREQRAARLGVDERHEAEADRELERVDLRAPRPRRRRAARRGRAGSRSRPSSPPRRRRRSPIARPSRKKIAPIVTNGMTRQARDDAHRGDDAACDHGRPRLAQHLRRRCPTRGRHRCPSG